MSEHLLFINLIIFLLFSLDWPKEETKKAYDMNQKMQRERNNVAIDACDRNWPKEETKNLFFNFLMELLLAPKKIVKIKNTVLNEKSTLRYH